MDGCRLNAKAVGLSSSIWMMTPDHAQPILSGKRYLRKRPVQSEGATMSSNFARSLDLGRLAQAVRLIFLLAVFALFAASASAESWKLKIHADAAYRRGDFKTAFKEYLKMAREKGGSNHAECQLGIMFERGEGTAQDSTQAVHWYQIAAQKGNSTAAINLALILDFGNGVPPDHTEAAKWYAFAANRGDVTAQYNLGCDYLNGTGVVQDFNQAALWFRRAASSEYAKAQIALGNLYWSGNGVERDLMSAASLFMVASKAADLEDAQTAAKRLEVLRREVRADEIVKAEHIAAAHLQAIEQQRLNEQETAEAAAAEQEAAAAAMAEAQAQSGPTYFDIVNQSLQNTMARQQAAMAAATAARAQEAARNQQAAALERTQQLAANRQVVQQVSALTAPRENSSQSQPLPMELHNECIEVKTQQDPTGSGVWLFFTNRCSQLIVINVSTQSGDGPWRGGEDCRSQGQWLEAFENTSPARYVARAQFVNSCSQEGFLQWPAAPR